MTFQEKLAEWNGGILRGAQTRLAKALGVQKSTIANWANGSAPGEFMEVKIASLFKMPREDVRALFVSKDGGAMILRESAPMLYGSSTTSTPVVGVVSADVFGFDFNHAPDEFLPIPQTGHKKTAALKVSGACMEPTVADGDYVIVAEAEYVPDGKLGVFRLDGGCTLKRPYRRGEVVELRPDNPKFKTLRVPANKLEVVGVVVGFFRKP